MIQANWKANSKDFESGRNRESFQGTGTAKGLDEGIERKAHYIGIGAGDGLYHEGAYSL